MQVFNVATGKVTQVLESTREVKVMASAKSRLTLFGVCGKTRIPLETGENIRFKAKLSEDFDSLEITCHGKGQFGYSISERVITEPLLNDDHPPLPALPKNDNLVAQIHRIARQQSSIGRGPLEPDDDIAFFQRYEVDDDDYRFEEDLVEEASNSQQNDPTSKVIETTVAGASETENPRTDAESPQEPSLPLGVGDMAAE